MLSSFEDPRVPLRKARTLACNRAPHPALTVCATGSRTSTLLSRGKKKKKRKGKEKRKGRMSRLQSCACKKPAKMDSWYDPVNRAVRFERECCCPEHTPCKRVRRATVYTYCTNGFRLDSFARYVYYRPVYKAVRQACCPKSQRCGFILDGFKLFFLTSYRLTSCRWPLNGQPLSITSCRIASYGLLPLG